MTVSKWASRTLTPSQRLFLIRLADGPRLVRGQDLRLAQRIEAMGFCILGPVKRDGRGHQALATITANGKKRAA